MWAVWYAISSCGTKRRHGGCARFESFSHNGRVGADPVQRVVRRLPNCSGIQSATRFSSKYTSNWQKGGTDTGNLNERIVSAIKNSLGATSRVVIKSAGSFPVTEGKTRRVIKDN